MNIPTPNTKIKTDASSGSVSSEREYRRHAKICMPSCPWRGPTKNETIDRPDRRIMKKAESLVRRISESRKMQIVIFTI